MQSSAIELLVHSLTDPTSMGRRNMAEWDALIRAGRAAGLLGRMAELARHNSVWEAIPAGPRLHLGSAAMLVSRQQHELLIEIGALREAMELAGVNLVLLKGAAYVQAGLRAAIGRLVSDVDVLVPHDRLGVVESALMMRGWVMTGTTPYDQHYYRTWMHELPPMRHFHRGTTVDVHHALLPPTARLRPSTALLLDAAVECGTPNVRVLAPTDMLLHSASHLMHEGEFVNGLRGLCDIDALAREFAQLPAFWEKLVDRAAQLDLSRPSFYALRHAQRLFGTPVPVHTLEALRARAGVSSLSLWTLDWTLPRALAPHHPLIDDAFAPLARGFMFLRGHWLRMPPNLLLRHLSYKLWLSLRGSPEHHLEAPTVPGAITPKRLQ